MSIRTLRTGPLINHNLPATRLGSLALRTHVSLSVPCRDHTCSATPANVHVLADGFIAGAAPLQSRLPVANYYLFVPDNTVWLDFAALSRQLVAAAAPTPNRPHGSVVVTPVYGSAGADRTPIPDWCEQRACASPGASFFFFFFSFFFSGSRTLPGPLSLL